MQSQALYFEEIDRSIIGIEDKNKSASLIYLCALILAILQIMDGILTACGLKLHGIHAEGNPFLRTLMLDIGVEPTLVIFKVIAITIIFALYKHCKSIPWLPNALKAVIVIYTTAAIIPWIAIIIASY